MRKIVYLKDPDGNYLVKLGKNSFAGGGAYFDPRDYKHVSRNKVPKSERKELDKLHSAFKESKQKRRKMKRRKGARR